MTINHKCKNCTHSKEDHVLTVEYPGGPKVLSGTTMYDPHLESKIKCIQCTCQNYVSINDTKLS